MPPEGYFSTDQIILANVAKGRHVNISLKLFSALPVGFKVEHFQRSVERYACIRKPVTFHVDHICDVCI